MITYEQIEEVNKALPRMDIKGKPYAAVPARVNAFRKICPNGTIETEILFMADGVVTMKATVKDEEGRVLGTGTAQEKESGSYINKTSYIENCETSAVGRALGQLGLGSETSMASVEEMVNALANQKKTEEVAAEKIDHIMATALTEKMKNKGVPLETILATYKLEKLEEMTVEQYRNCNNRLDKT